MHNVYQTIVKTSNLSEIKAVLTANLEKVCLTDQTHFNEMLQMQSVESIHALAQKQIKENELDEAIEDSYFNRTMTSLVNA